MDDEALRTDDVEGIGDLATALREAGFTGPAVEGMLHLQGPFERDPDDLPVYLQRLSDDTPLATLIKLFYLGVAVESAEAARALAPLSLARLEAMGLLRVADRQAQALVEIAAIGDLYLTSDPTKRAADRADHVLGLSRPAAVLAALTVRQSGETVLDLGCGSGIQSLLAARHATLVVATDINPRATRYAEFNAHLNGVSGIDCRTGDLFDPVEGRTFDSIVCNPPYVISPESRFVYRDSGLAGDAFCRHLVGRVPAFLREGGFGHVVINWVHGQDEEWAAPVAAWVRGTGCDAMLLRYGSNDILSYAAAFNRQLRSSAALYRQVLEEWLAYYRRLGITTINVGAIILRRRDSDDNWFWSYSPPAERPAPASHHVLRCFAAQDYLRRVATEQTLLDDVFRFADDHRLEETMVFVDGGPLAQESVLRLDGGLGPRVTVDAVTVTFLSKLDGRRTVHEALAAVHGTGAHQTAAALATIRRLLELGFLVRTLG